MRVGIAGAGVTGSVVALEALRLGWQATLFDSPDASHRCSNSAAGMLSPYAELETAGNDIFTLGMRSLDHWPALLQCLPQEVFFRRRGSLLTAHGSDLPVLRRVIDLIERKIGVRLAPLTSVQLQSLEPELAVSGQVFHLPDEGQIDSQMFMTAVAKQFDDSNLLRRAKVRRVAPNVIDLEDGSSHHFDWVFDCRGLGSKPDCPELRGVRGEIIWVHAPGVVLNRPVRLMHPRYHVYVVPRPGDVYLVGATEIETEDRSPLTVRSALELLSALFAIHSGFAEAHIVRTDVNLRPAFPDNRPRVEQERGLTRINGMFRHGFLLAPAVAQDAIEVVARSNESISKSSMEAVHAAD